MNETIFRAKVLKNVEVAKDTVEITFELERPMKFKAGQYIWVILDQLKEADPHGKRRAFSISSTPTKDKELAIILRKTGTGFNKSLTTAKIGDELTIHGPFGFSFTLPEDGSQKIIMLAGGTGVSPFLSDIRYAIEKRQSRDISLIVSNTSKERIIFADEIESFNKSGLNISTKQLIGKIDWDHIKTIGNVSNSIVFVSGPQDFVNYIYELCKSNGIFEHQLRFETFFPTVGRNMDIHKYFINGKPNIDPSESEASKVRANMLFELVNASSHHTIVTDSDGRIVFANKAAEEITGFSFQEMQGNTPRLWGGLMSKEFYDALWKSRATGQPINTELTNRRSSGDIYYVIAHISPIKNSVGDVIGFIGNEEDITDLKTSEKRALDNEERFMQLTEKIPEVYWITDLQPTEKVVYVSPTFENIWGIPRSALYQNSRVWTDHIHSDDKERVKKAFENMISTGANFETEYRVVRPDGSERIVRDRGDIVVDEKLNKTRIVGVARDITMERSVDKQKTEFVSLASHQLKTPIGAMNWNVEMLLNGDYGAMSMKQKEVLDEVYTLGNRMNELVNGLLNVSRIESGSLIIEPVPTDFVKLCQEVLMEMKSRIAKKGHQLVTSFAEKIEKVPADQRLLRVIFQNFISNAIKYTPDKGKIGVSIKIDGDNIVFSVSNNGEPIPSADQSKIFGKMFRASNANTQDPDGNGLGLYIVKDIVETAGGKIWFTSKAGEDTVFYASFPLTGMKSKAGSKQLL
jgi:PAS domain S-box-containing protein